jgi:hypothetical protein
MALKIQVEMSEEIVSFNCVNDAMTAVIWDEQADILLRSVFSLSPSIHSSTKVSRSLELLSH